MSKFFTINDELEKKHLKIHAWYTLSLNFQAACQRIFSIRKVLADIELSIDGVS